MNALQALRRLGVVETGELASALCVTPQSIGTVLSALHRRGLVVAQGGSHRYSWSITMKGRERLRREEGK